MAAPAPSPASGPRNGPHRDRSWGQNGRGKHWIEHWEPEDETFWATTGQPVARRNLIWSIFAEFLGFSVWLAWSVVAIRLNDAGFNLSASQLFTLVAVPNLVGATVRFPYTFAVPRFGGRNWTVVSALLLLIPTVLLAAMVTNPSTPYWALLLAAATAGLGGGNFASSMANISFFYPDARKGLALGLNAAGGNVGVAVLQLVAPFAVTAGAIAVVGGSQGAAGLHLQNVGLMLIPFILAAAVCAWRFMDNLATARSSFRDQAVVVKRRHTWTMSWLYVGTFGSFIGYSAGLPLLIKGQFADPNAIKYAFLGPLVGSVSRPLGGWLADKLGGARVTVANFGVMAAAVVGVLVFLANKDQPWAFAGFLAMFLVLFVATGVGNGSTFRMVPVIFRAHLTRQATDAGVVVDEAAVAAAGRRESAAALGVISAVGAYGGFLIPQSFGLSANATGGPQAALVSFIAFYGSCMLLTWWCYLRTRVATERLPNLAWARP